MPRTMEVQVNQVGPATSEGHAGSHRVPMDRPVEKGGDDRGPMGGQLLLMSLAGCFLSNLFAAAKARSADISNVRVKVTATVGGVPERIEAMEMDIRANYPERDQMEKLVSIAERGCLVTNTLRTSVLISFTIHPSGD